MRWRNRFAVVGFSCQIGASTRNTSSVVMSSTGRSPSRGKANSSRVPIHCAACLALRQPALRCSKSARASSAKVGMPRARRRSTFGFSPARTMRRFASAASRASRSVTTGYGPSPNSCRRPCTVIRCFQHFAPPGVANRNNPCPSNIRPGAVAAFTARSLSAECSLCPPPLRRRVHRPPLVRFSVYPPSKPPYDTELYRNLSDTTIRRRTMEVRLTA